MGINKVNYGNTTLIDISNDTVTADKLAQGYTAHDNTGAAITGTMSGGTMTSKTVSPATYEQVVLPNYDTVGGVAGIYVKEVTGDAVYDFSVNLNIVSGHTYYVVGHGRAMDNMQSTHYTHNLTFEGTWVYGTNLPFTETSATQGQSFTALLDSVKLTATTLTITFKSSTTSLAGNEVYIDSLEIREASGTTYDGLSQVAINAYPEAIVASKSARASSAATSISVSDLGGEPIAFTLVSTDGRTRSSSNTNYYTECVTYDGSTTMGMYYRMSNGNVYAGDETHYSFSYSNGTLTLTSSSSSYGKFYGHYELIYVYLRS